MSNNVFTEIKKLKKKHLQIFSSGYSNMDNTESKLVCYTQHHTVTVHNIFLKHECVCEFIDTVSNIKMIYKPLQQ